MDRSDELQKLEELHRTGALTDAEYEQAKARLTGTAELPPPPPPPFSGPAAVPPSPAQRTKDARDWATWMHLSVLAGLLVPYAGFVVPVVLWQVKKDELPDIDPHGKVIANWLISSLIYSVISGILVLACVGIFLLIVIALASIVFPIIGAIKAGKGEVWDYPGSISIFR